MKAYTFVTTAVAVPFVMTMTTVATATAAYAVGGDCHANRQHQAVTGYDNYRARAACDSLDGDSMARPKLIRDGGPDYTGPYFTTLDKYYYTSWYTCYAGCSASYEIAHV